MRNVLGGSLSPRFHLFLTAATLSTLAPGLHGCAGELDADGLGTSREALAEDAVATSSSSSTGSGGAGGGTDPGPGPAPASGPLGQWRFDDCDPGTTTLIDSSGNDATASRSARAACAAGIQGQAVAFDGRNDVVTVPNAPHLMFAQNLAIAAWVKPTSTSGVRTIAQREASGQSAFSLRVQQGNARFSVQLANGRTVTSSAPISAGAWTHVAGVYNGRFVFLFLNGEQVGQVSASGDIASVSAPIQIGNNQQQRWFAGLIDEVWLSNEPVSAQEVAELACLRHPATFTVASPVSGPVPPNTPITYDVALTNNDIGACPGADHFLQISSAPPGINVLVEPQFIPGVRPGQTVTFPITVTGTEDADPGENRIGFDIFNFSSAEPPLSGELFHELAEPAGCFVRTSRELMIKHLGVVEDPVRTRAGEPGGDPRAGAWTFARLMEDMAPSPEAAPAFVERLFTTWLSDQTVNGFVVPARPRMREVVLDSWPRRADGALDLAQAPLRLLAIVNRMDVRNLAQGNAGEGRFVFGVLGPGGFEEQFTVILEYKLPASTEEDVLGWANAWHALGSLPFPSEEYNAALQALTTRFAGRNAAPGRPNGSSLGQLRTNEISLEGVWELREFKLSAEDGFLHQGTVELTPDLGFDQTPALASFINQNEADIVAERHVVPETLDGRPFLAGSSFNFLSAWTAPGIANSEARHKFSLNTCNGCHGSAETGTPFLHVFPRAPGAEATLSGFLTGISLPDPVTGEPRSFNDLGRRNADLRALACEVAQPAAAGARAARVARPDASRSELIRRGIGRVH